MLAWIGSRASSFVSLFFTSAALLLAVTEDVAGTLAVGLSWQSFYVDRCSGSGRVGTRMTKCGHPV